MCPALSAVGDSTHDSRCLATCVQPRESRSLDAWHPPCFWHTEQAYGAVPAQGLKVTTTHCVDSWDVAQIWASWVCEWDMLGWSPGASLKRAHELILQVLACPSLCRNWLSSEPHLRPAGVSDTSMDTCRLSVAPRKQTRCGSKAPPASLCG